MSTELPPEPTASPRVVVPDEAPSAVTDGFVAPPVVEPAPSLGASLLWSGLLASVGAGIWAAITLITDYQLGLIAIAIGYLAGIGAAKGGRGRGAQVVGAAMAAFGYFLGQTFIVASLLSDQGEASGLLLVLEAVFVAVFASFSDFMSVLFLAIALWEGWRIPKRETDA